MTANLEKISLYEFLNVREDATREEIQEAYLLAVATYRPGSLATYTLVSDEERQKILSRTEQAFLVLGDSVQRQKYDRQIHLHDFAEGTGEIRVQAREEKGKGEEMPFRHSALWSWLVSLFPGIRKQPRLDPKQAGIDVQVSHHNPLGQESSLSSGHYLKYVRKMRGLTLKAISDDTRITKRYLEALEGEDYSILPQGTYLTYILGAYARALNLDPKSIVHDFNSRQGH